MKKRNLAIILTLVSSICVLAVLPSPVYAIDINQVTDTSNNLFKISVAGPINTLIPFY